MSQPDPGGGFLSRLLDRVRPSPRRALAPSAPVVQTAARPPSEHERKRRNDWVRQSEFDALRKIRRQARAEDGVADQRPSFLASTLTPPIDDRASTIQKINEIEAQMSRQWWTSNGSYDLALSQGLIPLDPLEDNDSPWLDESAFPPPAREGQGARAPSPSLWTAPAQLDAPAVAGLRRAVLAAPQPWVLDWSALQSLDTDAARTLRGLFALWAEQDLRLHFVGADVLGQRLMACTPIGHADTDPLWWALRLAALRVMNRADAFQRVARHFMTTYQRTAPHWEPPRCSCRPFRRP